MKKPSREKIPTGFNMCFFETDAITGFDSRISSIEDKSQYIEMKVYDTWSGSKYELDADKYVYRSLPDGVSNVKKIDFYFNETPYIRYNTQNKWDSTNPVAKDTVSITPGNSVPITQSRASWLLGVHADGRPYMYVYGSYGGATAYWNMALTIFM